MYNLKIGEDTADLLIRDVLVQDFQRINSSIDKLRARLNELKPFELEDLDADIEVRDALIVMLRYYLPLDEANDVIHNRKQED